MNTLQNTIESAWNDRTLLNDINTQNAIREVINLIDSGPAKNLYTQ